MDSQHGNTLELERAATTAQLAGLADRGEACPACGFAGLIGKVTRPGLPPFLCNCCGHRWAAHAHFPQKAAA